MYVAKFVYAYYSVSLMTEKQGKKKVVALLSGGLDSTLAVKTMQSRALKFQQLRSKHRFVISIAVEVVALRLEKGQII